MQMGPAGTQTGTTGAGASSAHLNAEDMSFLRNAAASGLSEVHEGQLAQSKGNAAVRQIGERMVADHTKVNRELTTLAQSKGITIPTSVTNTQAAQEAQLKETGGASFNRIYLRDQLRAHEQAIKLFQTEARSGTDPDLKQFASANLPTLQEHLRMIEAAQNQEGHVGA
jgi:putative membrane protein